MRYFVLALLCMTFAESRFAIGQEPLPQQPGNPAAATPPAQPPSDQAFQQMVSYTLGMNFGNNLKQNEIVVDLASLVAGITDALKEAKPKYTDEQLAPVMQRFQQEMQQKAQARMMAIGEKNKREGAAFLAENKTKPGVQVTPSGLQYRVIQKGDGPMPKETDTVRCHYRGTFLDGTEFDSSIRAGEPAEFAVTGVIPGWTEALQLMHVGDKWQLFIPSDLAYGERGNQGIGPNETLLFELELLEVAK